jgi:hypothetical protein
MKPTSKIKLILIIAFTGFLVINRQIGYFYIPLFSVPNNSVRVKFKNESDQPIKAIYINGQTINSLKIGDSYIYTYRHSSGEGTYQFEVEFERGNKLKEQERYVEEGYYITEIIKNNSVETHY